MTFSVPTNLRSWFASHADKSDEQVAELLHYGVELEFDRADGLQNPSIDNDEAWERILENDMDEFLRSCLTRRYHNLSNVQRNSCFMQSSFVESGMIFAASAQREDLDLEEWIDTYCGSSVREDVLSEFRYSYNESESSDGWINVSGWRHESDGTSGIEREYNSDGPTDYADLCERVNRLLDHADDWNIPVNGSCHVHVSVPGMRHKLSDDSKLGQCLLAELFSTLADRLHSSLYERWDNDLSYFNPTNRHSQKYTALHSHRYGSLEFRLFGHCKTRREILTNIKTAGLAFVRGYRRFLAGEFVNESISAFRRSIRNCMLDCDARYEEPHPYTVFESIGSAVGESFASVPADGAAMVFIPSLNPQLGDLCLLRNGETTFIENMYTSRRDDIFSLNNGWVYDDRLSGLMYQDRQHEYDVILIVRNGGVVRNYADERTLQMAYCELSRVNNIHTTEERRRLIEVCERVLCLNAVAA